MENIVFQRKKIVYRIVYWTTKKVKILFPLKDKNIYPACKIYHAPPFPFFPRKKAAHKQKNTT